MMIMLVVLAWSVAPSPGQSIEDFQKFPRTPAYGPFVQISEKTPLEVAPSHTGDGVLVLGRSDGSGNGDLDFYGGEDFGRHVPVLQGEAVLFGLGARGYPVGSGLVFSVIRDTRLLVLTIAGGSSPQGGPDFTLTEVTEDDGFASSDLFVSPSGDVFVLGYDAVGDFQPRLFWSAGAPLQFHEIDLGLSGTYLGAAFGSPRMRIVPHLYNDNQIYLFATKQFTAAQSQIVVIGVTPDLPSPAGARSPANHPIGATFDEDEIARLPTPRVQIPEGNEETAAVPIGRDPDPAMSFFYFDGWHFLAATYDPASGESIVSDLGCPPDPILKNVEILQTGVSAEYGRTVGGTTNVIVKSGTREFVADFADDQGSLADFRGWEELRIRNPESSPADEGWIGRIDGPISRDRLWFFTSRFDSEEPSFGFRRAYAGETSVFPQLVQEATSYQVTNSSDQAQRVQFYAGQQDGTIFQSGEWELAPAASVSVDVEGEFPRVGAAWFQSEFPLTVQGTWKLSDRLDTPNAGGPGIGSSRLWALSIENNQEKQTGLGIVNNYNWPNMCQFDLYDETGTHVETVFENYAAGEQRAFFASELFDGTDESRGILYTGCAQGVSLTGATQESSGAIVLVPGWTSPRKARFGFRFKF